MCDFLLMLHSNHGPISHHFQDRWQFQLKIAKFFPPAYILYPPLKGFPLELGISARGQKTRIMGLPGRTRSLTISLAVWIQYTNVTDGQTDGHRAIAKTALTHSVVRVKRKMSWRYTGQG